MAESDDIASESTAPADLVDSAGRFWEAGEDLAFLNAPIDEELSPALERLGPSPFAKSGFPILGFLATVYDHVAAHARRRAGSRLY